MRRVGLLPTRRSLAVVLALAAGAGANECDGMSNYYDGNTEDTANGVTGICQSCELIRFPGYVPPSPDDGSTLDPFDQRVYYGHDALKAVNGGGGPNWYAAAIAANNYRIVTLCAGSSVCNGNFAGDDWSTNAFTAKKDDCWNNCPTDATYSNYGPDNPVRTAASNSAKPCRTRHGPVVTNTHACDGWVGSGW